MSDLVKRLNEVLSCIEQSPKRTQGGAGGQTIEATLASQMVQVSMLDVQTMYEARDAIEALQTENTRLKTEMLNGGRELPLTRDELGRFVREAWVRWAKTQPSPKSSWLDSYDELSEADKEADRQIGESIARWTLIFDSIRLAKNTK